MLVNQRDVVKAVANKEGLPTGVVNKVLNSIMDVVVLSVSVGEDVMLREFGKFSPRQKNAVRRRNPKTGDQVEVPEKMSVHFAPSPSFKGRLND